MENRSTLRWSSALFMVQAFAWCFLSVLCILCLEISSDSLSYYGDSYNAFLMTSVYNIFFTKSLDHSNSYMVVKPAVFEGFAFMHLLLGLSWFITSAIIYFKSSRRNIEFLQKSNLLKSWLINGYMVAIIDFIFTILLMVDLIETNSQGLFNSILATPPIGLVFALFSRGFTLWIVNVAFIVKMTRSMWMNSSVIKHDDARYGYAPTMSSQVLQRGYPTTAHAQQATASPGYPTSAQVSPYTQLNRLPSPGGPQSPSTSYAGSPPQIPGSDYQMNSRTVVLNGSQYDVRY